MPVGFQTILDGGSIVQIDQDTQAWQLKQTGTVTYNLIVPFDELGNGRYGVVTIISAVPILLALTGSHAIRHIYRSGTTWRFYISGPLDFPTPATSTYYVFEPSNTLLANFGLAVYDAAGNLCFQSGGKPLRIVGNAPGTYTAGRTYAAILCQYATANTSDPYVDEETGENGWFDYGTIKGADVTGNVVTAVDIDMYSTISIGGSSIGSWNDPHSAILVVDVTGF